MVTTIAYFPALHGGAIWDDDAYLTSPELRSFHGLVRIWTHAEPTQQYYPLVYSAFWLEQKIWGDATFPYHLLNVVLHAISAVLLLVILHRLKIPGVLALTFFVLGLLCKTVIATLPAALLVVFWWQRGKVTWKRDVRPLVPFFAAGIAVGIFTGWVERTTIGAQDAAFSFSFVERCLIAGRAFWFYLGKLFWPNNLIFIYPRWQVSAGIWWQYMFPLAGLLLFLLLWLWRKKTAGAAGGIPFVCRNAFSSAGLL